MERGKVEVRTRSRIIGGRMRIIRILACDETQGLLLLQLGGGWWIREERRLCGDKETSGGNKTRDGTRQERKGNVMSFRKVEEENKREKLWVWKQMKKTSRDANE